MAYSVSFRIKTTVFGVTTYINGSYRSTGKNQPLKGALVPVRNLKNSAVVFAEIIESRQAAQFREYDWEEINA